MDPIVIKTNYKNTDTIVDLLLSAHIMQARLSVTVVCHGCVHSGWILGINTAPQVSSLCWIMRLMVLDDRCTSVGECKYNGRHFIFAVYAITPFRPVATPPPSISLPLSLYTYIISLHNIQLLTKHIIMVFSLLLMDFMARHNVYLSYVNQYNALCVRLSGAVFYTNLTLSNFVNWKTYDVRS